MSATDWIGYVAAVVLCLAFGWVLHRIHNEEDDTRAEHLAVAFGAFGIAVVLIVMAVDHL